MADLFGMVLILAAGLNLLLLGLLIGYPLRCRRRGVQARRGLFWSLVPLFAASLYLTWFCLNHWRNETRQMPEGTKRPWAQLAFAAGAPGNFYRVGPELYRSAQPDAKQMKVLEQLGIRSVINLRRLHTDRKEAAGTMLRTFDINSVAAQITLEQVAEFLRLLRDPDNLPALVHCEHGSDRTGTMVAFYRILHDGWSREEAIEEMKFGGFGFHFVYDHAIVNFIETADLDHLSELAGYPVVAPRRGETRNG